MPDYGTLALDALPDMPGVLGEPGGWDLASATVVSMTFELSKSQMMDLLPAPIIRPVPPYAKVVVVDAPESPVGPYREASLLLGAREGVQIRNVLVDRLVAGDGPLTAARQVFGGARRAGSIDLAVSDDELSGAIADDGGLLCSFRLGTLRRCDATMLKFDALLVPARWQGKASLLRGGVRVPLNDVEGVLSRDWEVQMPRTGTVWRQLRPAFNVTAFLARGPVRLEFAHPPREA